jgi:NTP pyrophosphatase (non-canonical NTP hydrolase)
MKDSNPIIPHKIREISLLETKTLVERGLKLTEEVGELAAEILKFEGLKPTNGKSGIDVLQALRLEAVDCMLMSMDILAYTQTTDDRIKEIIESQLEKWKSQLPPTND